MEFIGPVDPPSSGESYILVCIDYVTKWVEVRAMKNARDEKVAKFLYEEIFILLGRKIACFIFSPISNLSQFRPYQVP